MTSFTNYSDIQSQVGQQHYHGTVNVINYPPPKRTGTGSLKDDSSNAPGHRSGPSHHIDTGILSSLAFPDMLSRRSDIERPHQDSCNWILNHKSFREWDTSSQGLLWIKGKPGSGKSTMMAFLYERRRQIKKENTIHLDFFFNARGSELQHNPLGMFRCLLNQLYAADPAACSELRDLYEEKRRAFGVSHDMWKWQRPELQALLENCVLSAAKRNTVNIFIDALDEAGDTFAREVATFFHHITEFVTFSIPVKVCISCRHYPIASSKTSSEIHMEKYNGPSIAAFVHAHVDHGDTRGTDKTDHVHLTDLTEEVINKANGVFQWIRLVVPLINRYRSHGESWSTIRSRLQDTPQELGQMYSYIFSNVIIKEHYRHSLQLFRWVCLASRPLTLVEMEYALLPEDERTDLYLTLDGSISTVPTAGPNIEKRIKSWSAGLIELVKGRKRMPKVVQVIHQSVNDYLISDGLALLSSLCYTDSRPSLELSLDNPHTSIEHSHTTIFRACLSILADENVGKRVAKLEPNQDHYVKDRHLSRCAFQYPLLQYAVDRMFWHAQRAGGSIFRDQERDIGLLSKIIPTWIQLYHAFDTFYDYDAKRPTAETKLIHIASAYNLLNIVREALKTGEDVNLMDNEANTALHLAARFGSQEVVSFLLKSDADTEVENIDKEIPLLRAIYSRQMMIVKVLYGATKREDKWSRTLCVAARQGYTEVLRFLLSDDKNAWSTRKELNRALRAAVRGNHVAAVDMIIGAGADPSDHEEGKYLLHEAIGSAGPGRDESSKIVKSLIAKGVDVNTRNPTGDSPLVLAVRYQHYTTINLLLRAGADTRTIGLDGSSVLGQACQFGNLGLVKQLIEADLDESARSRNAEHALCRASGSCEPQVVQFLLRTGVNPNAKCHTGSTALHHVASIGAGYRSQRTLTRMLLEAGADANAQDNSGHTPLYYAARFGATTKVLKLLFKAGAEVNLESGPNGTVLQAALSCTAPATSGRIGILLSNGSNTYSPAVGQNSLLHDALFSLDTSLVKTKLFALLISKGADVNARNTNGVTVLLTAIDLVSPRSKRYMAYAVRHLIHTGADVNETSQAGRSALTAACYQDARRLSRMILRKGANVNVQGGVHCNALQAAALKGNLHMVRKIIRRGVDVNAKGGEFGNALLAACQCGSTAIVKLLIEAGADLHASCGLYGTALQTAAKQPYPEIVRLFLASGYDVQSQSATHDNALYNAASIGNKEVVRMLIEAGMDVDYQAVTGTPLIGASRNNAEQVVDVLLDAGADVNMCHRTYGHALGHAASQGHLKIVLMLLRRGADVNLKSEEHGTALQAACCADSAQPEELIQLLLDAGADCNASGGLYGSPIHAACYMRRISLVKMLLDAGASVDALHDEFGSVLQATMCNDYVESTHSADVLQLLIDAGADVNMVGGTYNTALQAAAFDANPTAVRVLLKAGATVNIQGGYYGNALQASLVRTGGGVMKQLYIAKTLIAAGADVNACGGYHHTACQAMLANSMFSSVGAVHDALDVLLEAGADIKLRGGDSGDVLKAAINAYTEVSMVSRLLDLGVDVNDEGGRLHTALQSALVAGDEPVVRRLLEAGADVNASGGKWGTPLQAAAQRGQVSMVKALLEAGADVSAPGGIYGNALVASVVSCNRDNNDIPRILLDAGADINAMDPNVGSALQVALSAQAYGPRMLNCVETLIAAGVDVNATGLWPRPTPLQTALQPLERLPFPSVDGKPFKTLTKLLIQAGADVNGRGGPDYTALESALLSLSQPYGCNEDVVRQLLEAGANTSARLGDGRTSLHTAIIRKDRRVCEILLKAHADITIVDSWGRTPLHYAAMMGMSDVVHKLHERGAGLNTIDLFDRTPLHLSIYYGHTKVSELLVSFGTDICIRDGYGQTALDWLPAGSMLQASMSLQSVHLDASPQQLKVQTLRTSVCRLSQNLLSKGTRRSEPGFEELGRCLIFLGEVEDARFSYTQTMRKDDSFGDLYHDRCCDMRNAHTAGLYIEGCRFICQTCPDLSLCSRCMSQKYSNKAPSPFCRDHEFLEVDLPFDPDLKAFERDDLSDSAVQWLKDLISHYENPQTVHGPNGSLRRRRKKPPVDKPGSDTNVLNSSTDVQVGQVEPKHETVQRREDAWYRRFQQLKQYPWTSTTFAFLSTVFICSCLCVPLYWFTTGVAG